MTTPDQLLTYVGRGGYERACAVAGTTPMSDHDAAKMAETGYERLSDLAKAGASQAEKVMLATHLRRGWSIHSGQPETTPAGTPLLSGVM